MQEKTMWRNVHLSVIDMQIQEKKKMTKRASIVLLRDAGLWRERERQTHTRLADALLSLPISDSLRFTSFGTPSFDAEESNSPSSGSRSSAIPSSPGLFFLPARLLLRHHPHSSSLPRTFDFGTQLLDLSRPPYQFHRHSCYHATTTNAHFVRARRLFFTSVRFFPLLLHLLVVSTIKTNPNWRSPQNNHHHNKSTNKGRRREGLAIFFSSFGLFYILKNVSFIGLFSLWSHILRIFSKGAQFSFGSHIFEIKMFIWVCLNWVPKFLRSKCSYGLFSFGSHILEIKMLIW